MESTHHELFAAKAVAVPAPAGGPDGLGTPALASSVIRG
jgi:hypothetical protein